MNNKYITEKARNKAFSKILTLEHDVSKLSKEIKNGGDGRVSLDILSSCLTSTKNELKTWQFIANLIEKYGYK